jgi:hypothetical protein
MDAPESKKGYAGEGRSREKAQSSGEERGKGETTTPLAPCRTEARVSSEHPSSQSPYEISTCATFVS